jgi:hypothetical protein
MNIEEPAPETSAQAARSLTEPVKHVFEETETTSDLTNQVRDVLAQITEDVRALKSSVVAVVRNSTEEEEAEMAEVATDAA